MLVRPRKGDSLARAEDAVSTLCPQAARESKVGLKYQGRQEKRGQVHFFAREFIRRSRCCSVESDCESTMGLSCG